MAFKVKAIYEYSSNHEDDLPFEIGQIITVTEEEDADWYAGEYIDDSGVKHEGIFPRNFVEKFEPTAPPRPTRTRTRKEHESAPLQTPATEEPPEPTPTSAKQAAPAPDVEPAPASIAPASPPGESANRPLSPVAPSAPVPPTPKQLAEPAPFSSSPPPVAKPAEPSVPKAAPAQPKPGPPPVSEKPTGSSFRDRIAAFNKPAAPPVAPFKPSGLGSGNQGFVKKPFVAPPPSRNSFVPPPRDAPVAKVYRRDEDPEIKQTENENRESAEKAGLAASGSNEGEEDQPKPTSLKERIALLQKQQMEQAQRHAEALAKKEKPKRPAKKRTESHEGPGPADEGDLAQPPTLERRDTEETGGKRSLDEPHPPRIPHPPRRRSSKGPEPKDGNEADLSGAGETTEDQEDLTEKEDSDDRARHAAAHSTAVEEEEEEEEGEEDEEEDEDEDPEVRRREELRARIAKMSGGMGMHGMFGPPPVMPMPMGVPAPPRKKKTSSSEKRPSIDSQEAISPGGHAPPVPTMVALPGMTNMRSPEGRTPTAEQPGRADAHERSAAEDAEEEEEEEEEPTPSPSVPSRAPGGPPPIPAGRPAPPPIPTDSRPPPPPPASGANAPSEGSESDDELSEYPQRDTVETPRDEVPSTSRAPPPPPVAVPPPAIPTSPRSPTSKRRSYIGEPSPASPSVAAPPPPSRRDSRLPPPIPGSAPAIPPAQTRPPPPPPPGAPSRTSTSDNRPLSPSQAFSHEANEGDEEVTEYEGDYDTDIASSVPHKDALKSHERESSFEDTISARSPITEGPPSAPPPVPSGAAPRAVPPPPPVPSQPPPDSRRSADVPRAAPPPPPKESAPTPTAYDDDYDPYNYTSPSQGVPVMSSYAQPPPPPRPIESVYSPSEPSSSYQQPPELRAPPPAPPSGRTRHSVDMHRAATLPVRRSIDTTRPSMETGYVANDIDLAEHTGWWLQPNNLPPQLQGRKDIFFESEESQSSKRGGKTTITRDIYILYQDYSQTVITVRFDPQDSSDVHLEQRHEAPPRALRQDQLEESYERFGRPISDAVTSKKDTVVADGTPQGLIHELLKPFRDALHPVGTRAYGALVYSNLANASTTQNDEIRPGDIISIRNAKFQGKHGPMHAKYSVEVGKPDHVAVVAEWDGTKKKVRAWEQGRESKKVKIESFKLDDLRSGEVKIWRVMPRSWVGWEGQTQG